MSGQGPAIDPVHRVSTPISLKLTAIINLLGCAEKNDDKTKHTYNKRGLYLYRVVFLTGPPDFQYQNEKQVAANQD